MGGRRLSIQDPDRIVDDWSEKGAEARERRRQGYREERRALAAQIPVQVQPEHEGYRPPLPSPEIFFPEWDFLLKPWGPPLDDPRAMAYREVQWKALKGEDYGEALEALNRLA